MSYISAHSMLKPIAAAREQDELKPIISERTVRRFFRIGLRICCYRPLVGAKRT